MTTMKKLLTITCVLFIFFLLNSCAPLNKYSISSTSIDLSKFEDQEIFITTGDLSKSYKSLSIISVDCYNGYEPKANKANKPTKKNKDISDDIYGNGNISGTTLDKVSDYQYKPCIINDLFDEMILKAKEYNANGIIRLEIRSISRSGIDPKTTQSGIELVGLAVNIVE